MTTLFVPDDFIVPHILDAPGFHLEPLGAEHNERDHEAWMSSIDHIKSTPGFAGWNWPQSMDLAANLSDLVGHAADFANRRGFTFSILDGDDVIGCVYIYPHSDAGYDASVHSWVRASRADMDVVIWKYLSNWLTTSWPFDRVDYAARP